MRMKGRVRVSFLPFSGVSRLPPLGPISAWLHRLGACGSSGACWLEKNKRIFIILGLNWRLLFRLEINAEPSREMTRSKTRSNAKERSASTTSFDLTGPVCIEHDDIVLCTHGPVLSGGQREDSVYCNDVARVADAPRFRVLLLRICTDTNLSGNAPIVLTFPGVDTRTVFIIPDKR